MISTRTSMARAAPSLLAAFRPRAVQTLSKRITVPQRTIQQQRFLSMRPTKRMMKAPEDDHRAHSVTQRLGQLRKVPVELWPLAAVLAIAIVAAGYSLYYKLTSDVTLRLWRKGKQEDH